MRQQSIISACPRSVFLGLALLFVSAVPAVLATSIDLGQKEEIRGSVVWADTKEPIGGVLVTPRVGKEESRSIKTESSGEFVVSSQGVDTLIVSLAKTTATGFVAVDWMQEFKVTGTSVVLAIPRPKKVVVLAGQVVPIALGSKAELQVVSNTEPRIGQSTFADGEGRFQFIGLPDASYRVTVIAQNGVTVQIPELAVPRRESLTIPLVATSTNTAVSRRR